MKRRTKAFVLTSVIGFIGLCLGGALDLLGYPGIILAIATMGTFIISAIEDNQSK